MTSILNRIVSRADSDCDGSTCSRGGAHLSTGAVIGIVIAVFAVLVAVSGLICYRSVKKHKANRASRSRYQRDLEARSAYSRKSERESTTVGQITTNLSGGGHGQTTGHEREMTQKGGSDGEGEHGLAEVPK